MDFFSRGYNALVGEGKNYQQDPVQTIQKLSDRVYASTLIEDKRAAVLGLKGLSREYKQLVGKEAIPPLLNVLQEESEDPNLIKSTLETLNNLIAFDQNDEPRDLSTIHARKIVENDSHISKVLELIGDQDFYIRYNALQQLTLLFAQLSELLISKILVSPTGVGRFVDLLVDPREIIRNECVQLLILMTEKNAEIQKILVFENTFEKLFNIITDEGGVGGNIMVQDCLQLLYNLLAFNTSNQKYFRETSCIQKLPELVKFEPPQTELAGYSPEVSFWKEQHIENMFVLLKIVRMLVQPENVDTSVNQTIMQQYGMISPLLQLSLSIEVPSTIRGLALCSIGDIIQSNLQNQFLFQRTLITAQSEEEVEQFEHNQIDTDASKGLKKSVSEPAALVIARLAIGIRPFEMSEESYFVVRNSAAYLIKSFLKDNPDARISVAATFTPPPIDESVEDAESILSLGSLLVSIMAMPLEGLTQIEAIRIWHATSIFSLLLCDDDVCKKLALKTSVESYNDSPDVPLLVALSFQAIQSLKLWNVESGANKSPVPSFSSEGKENFLCIQFLCALCIWTVNSPESVSALLSNKEFILFLTEIITEPNPKKTVLSGVAAFLFGIIYEFNSSSSTNIKIDELYLILSKRIGIDNLLLRLTKLNDSQEIHNAFSNSFDNLIFLNNDSVPVVFDSSFANLLRDHINQTKSFLKKTPDMIKKLHENSKLNGTSQNLKSQNADQNAKNSGRSSKGQESESAGKETEKLKAMNEELLFSLDKLKIVSTQHQKESEELKLQVDSINAQWEEKFFLLQNELQFAKSRILELESLLESSNERALDGPRSDFPGDGNSEVLALEEKFSALEMEHDDLLALLADQDAQCKEYRNMLRQLGQEIPPSDSED
ncbi:hypothetical protein BB560_006089 [Smittium megazygosporum]|uniref:Vesicle tethering protein Uso1/P115-like head domain-containing protein n=1 Tax=Smittium megazygosporum TaxID=133381 RepID=A0A2T9YI41_9FUNG|nr:hypothetical protein BB560_006089 [Smittium megazygosporum]